MSIEQDIRDLSLKVDQTLDLTEKDRLSSQLLQLRLQKGRHRVITTTQMHETMHKAADGVGERVIQGINND